MTGNLLTVASLPTPAEAEIVRLRLDAEGIRSFLSGENLVGINWLVSNAVGGVKVQVAQRDYERAVAALSVRNPDWQCPRCGEEITGAFDVCWSCGASPEDEAEPAAANRTETASVGSAPAEVVRPTDEPKLDTGLAPVEADFSNPYLSPRAPGGSFEPETAVPEEPRDTSEGDVIAERAWRASVFGLLFCPVLLQFYSAYLLLMIGLKGLPLGRTGARRFNAAWIFNIGYLLVLGAFFLPIPGWSRVIRTWLDVWMNY